MEPNELKIENEKYDSVIMDTKTLYLVFMGILTGIFASALVGLVVLVWKAFEHGVLSLN